MTTYKYVYDDQRNQLTPLRHVHAPSTPEAIRTRANGLVLRSGLAGAVVGGTLAGLAQSSQAAPSQPRVVDSTPNHGSAIGVEGAAAVTGMLLFAAAALAARAIILEQPSHTEKSS